MRPQRPNPKLTRRQVIAGATALGAATAFRLPRPALAQGLSGEITFATNEWTLPYAAKSLRAVTESFVKKYPNVRVQEVAIPFAGFHDQILTQLTAGTPPDIFRIDDPQLPLYMERGYLTPLDDALKDAGIDTSKFVAAGRDARFEGKTYGIVKETNPRALFYNKQILAAAGIAGPPTNVQEFGSYIERSTSRERGVYGYALATKPGDVVGMFIYLMPLVIGFGAHFTTAEGRPNATDPRIAEALNFAKRIWDGNHTPRGLDGVSALKLVTDGRIAMTLNGSFVVSGASEEVKPQLGAAPSPLPGKTAVRGGVWYGVAQQSKNKAAATAWLMHMLLPEHQALIAEARTVPALPQYIPAQVFAETPWFKVVAEAAGNSVSYVPPGLGSRGFAQIKVIAEQIESVLYRGTPVETAMVQLQRDLETALR